MNSVESTEFIEIVLFVERVFEPENTCVIYLQPILLVISLCSLIYNLYNSFIRSDICPVELKPFTSYCYFLFIFCSTYVISLRNKSIYFKKSELSFKDDYVSIFLMEKFILFSELSGWNDFFMKWIQFTGSSTETKADLQMEIEKHESLTCFLSVLN